MEIKEKTEKRFLAVFLNKGNMGPIAEKAVKNFDTINQHDVSLKERIHHFAIGHAFRNVDKAIFEYELVESKEKLLPSRFINLQLDRFPSTKRLFDVIKNIRNCNGHYVHAFDKLSINEMDKRENNSDTNRVEAKIIDFLKEAFEFSVMIHYLKENELHYEDFKATTDKDTKLVTYLCNKFFPNIVHQEDVRESFIKLNFKEALDELLFIEVDEDFEWKIDGVHKVFDIKQGKYLSFVGQLFLLSLFLYKHEANQLISKIKGFKRNDDEHHYKRDIFTFFSKKVSSQDIHSEEKHLIQFRDIIQYLNHFPTEWNEYLSPKRLNLSMTDQLEKYIIETEIFSVFPKYKNCKRELFLKYAISRLFPDKLDLFDAHSLTMDDKLKKDFDYEIDASPELKNVDLKLTIRLKPHDFNKQIKRKRKLEKEVNPNKLKLQKKVQEDKLLVMYGRNQDRFMEFAVRFLAEESYFGKDAEFKMYRFYSSDEQNDFLRKQKEESSKKEIDGNKYHQGRLTHYITYSEHKERYPSWDNSFVFQNNAFQLILSLSNGEKRKFSIQRKLLIYLLEDALYGSSGSIEGKGKQLVEDYFLNYLMPDFEEAKNTYSGETLNAKHRQLLPKRLLYTYHPPVQNNGVGNSHPFEKILNETEQQEKRYLALQQKAKSLGIEEEFLKRNKGKQFKLRFIRKAWHLMYFKESYQKQAEVLGHHKGFHITKDEFDDFSKWMFAFDEVPQYKVYLKRLLESKQFLDNSEFAHLFDQGRSLNDFYVTTKKEFERRLKENLFQLDKNTESGQYDEILSKKLVYINVSHFINYLKFKDKIKEQNGVIRYAALDNIKYLIKEYYYADVLPKEQYKENGKLFNKLRTAKLEDALLYELAMKYLKTDKHIVQKVRTNVVDILTSKVIFDIKDAWGNHLYNLVVPFSKLETLAVLLRYKTSQEEIDDNNRTSYLGNIYQLLTFLKDKINNCKDDDKKKSNKYGDILRIVECFNKHNVQRKLTFEDLNSINNYIISGAVEFSKIHMELEKYFILKYKIESPKFIDIKKIKNEKGVQIFEIYYESIPEIRRKAYHFGVPERFIYEQENKKTEAKFIQEEVKPQGVLEFKDLSRETKTVCRVFMNILHANLFVRDKNKSDEEKKNDFEKRYFKEVIQNVK